MVEGSLQPERSNEVRVSGFAQNIKSLFGVLLLLCFVHFFTLCTCALKRKRNNSITPGHG